MKDLLLTNQRLKIPLKTDDMYHVFNDRTIYDEYFKRIMEEQIFNDDKRVASVVELLERDPDYLLFSER